MKILSVSDFLALVNETLRLIPSEAYVVEGEVSDYRVSQGKWVNFDLKDEEAEAKVPCFAVLQRLQVPLESGMRVRVRGGAKVFERFGKFSLNVDEVIPVGQGALQKAYLALKKKLEAEGLFDADRKRSLPNFPDTIGLITSKEAAAYGDFLRILNNRFGGMTIVHANVHVQGQYAVNEICQAFAEFNALPIVERPQVIVLTRGGGGLEDLHAFNDERVARVVFSSAVPVIVGVGHERDESLCDFVADVRASTPSNAAEMLVPDRRDVAQTIMISIDRVTYRLEHTVGEHSARIEKAMRIFEHAVSGAVAGINSSIMRFSHAFDRFRLSIVATREHIERREKTVTDCFVAAFDRVRREVFSLERLLENVDPKKVLSRGYAIVRKRGHALASAAALAAGDRLSVQFTDGSVDAAVLGNSKQPSLL